MGEIQEIFSEYARMRENGLDAKSALHALRTFIEPLNKQEKQQLAQQVRTWESQAASEPPPTGSRIQPLKDPRPSSIRKLNQEAPAQPVEAATWVNCPNCGKTNQKHEVFCYSCGQLLEPTKGAFDTKHFGDSDSSLFKDDYFGPDSVLALRVRGSAANYETRPQLRDHELVIGRSTSGSAMAPDIDLADHQGGDLGVSRLHLSIKYDGEHNTVHVADLGSANGSFINGQKLHPKESRVLRHGDELRLGKLMLKISFRHPGKALDN
jgi:predicted RNA-binding Zn-ribbon protein involved in translation (DUF1610 family)